MKPRGDAGDAAGTRNGTGRATGYGRASHRGAAGTRTATAASEGAWWARDGHAHGRAGGGGWRQMCEPCGVAGAHTGRVTARGAGGRRRGATHAGGATTDGVRVVLMQIPLQSLSLKDFVTRNYIF